MSLRRSRLTAGMVAIAVTPLLILAASVPTGAVELKATHQASHSSKGSGARAYCQLYRAEAANTSKISSSLEKDIEVNDWASAKKLLLSEFSQDGKLIKAFRVILTSAPPNVRSAGAVAIRAIPAEQRLIERADSVAQYEVAIEKAFATPQIQAAEKTFSQYEAITCGTVTPST